MKFILGKKIEMTQTWKNGNLLTVSKIQAGPCFISQIKKDKSDSYTALQLAYDEKKEKNISKPVKGHLKKAGLKNTNARYLKEFRVDEIRGDIKTGACIDVSTFKPGDIVDVSGVSKGKGFQGVVRRHGFAGRHKTHGNKDQLRAPGSIGAIGPARVFKGARMGGRMGGDRVTIKNLEIIEIDLENNILFVKGAVPGFRGSLLMIKGNGDLILREEKKEEVKEEIKEDNKEKEEVKEGVKEDNKEKEEVKEEEKEDNKEKEEVKEEKENKKEEKK
jgi:large subunit ribosomal protein L3